jgi:hypothetical protein
MKTTILAISGLTLITIGVYNALLHYGHAHDHQHAPTVSPLTLPPEVEEIARRLDEGYYVSDRDLGTLSEWMENNPDEWNAWAGPSF